MPFCTNVIFYFRLLALNAIYIHGVLFESLAHANDDILNISSLLTEFEQTTLPTTTLAVLNLMKPSVSELRSIIFDSGLQRQLQFLESALSNEPQANFTLIHNSLKKLRFDSIATDLEFNSVVNASGKNVFGTMFSEFSKWQRFFHALTDFSKRTTYALSWVHPWIASSWPWLLFIAFSFLQLQSVVIRSSSIFSTIISAASWLQLFVSFVAFILFSLSIIINDLCSFLPASNSGNWQIITDSSIFWNRIGKGCFSEQKRNMFAAFDPDEDVSCNSVLNVAEYSALVLDVMMVSQSIGSVDVASELNSLQTINPHFVADFSGIRAEINQSSTRLSMQWPFIFKSMQQASKGCALVLHRFNFFAGDSTVIIMFDSTSAVLDLAKPWEGTTRI
jgi:hypothetical protein